MEWVKKIQKIGSRNAEKIKEKMSIPEAMGSWTIEEMKNKIRVSPDALCLVSENFQREGAALKKMKSLVVMLTNKENCENLSGEDQRLFDILKEASLSKLFWRGDDCRLGFEESLRSGLPKCMKIWADVAKKNGLNLNGEWLNVLIDVGVLKNGYSLGHIECIKEAQSLGIDINADQLIKGKKVTLLSEVLSVIGNSGSFFQYELFKNALGSVCHLIDLGADPVKATRLSGFMFNIESMAENEKNLWANSKAKAEQRNLSKTLERAGQGVVKKRAL